MNIVVASAEEAIRDVIAEINAGRPAPSTTDTVFWSGAYVKPFVRGEQPQARPGSSAAGNNRINQKTAVEVLQLHVAASGDMAYEYSTFQASWDRKDNGRHFAVEGGLLRVEEYLARKGGKKPLPEEALT